MLILFTIQLNNLPYNALAIASLASVASGIVFSRIMISPLATIPVEIKQSTKSLGTSPSNLATEMRMRI